VFLLWVLFVHLWRCFPYLCSNAIATYSKRNCASTWEFPSGFQGQLVQINPRRMQIHSGGGRSEDLFVWWENCTSSGEHCLTAIALTILYFSTPSDDQVFQSPAWTYAVVENSPVSPFLFLMLHFHFHSSASMVLIEQILCFDGG
jgi:hypothetical protein